MLPNLVGSGRSTAQAHEQCLVGTQLTRSESSLESTSFRRYMQFPNRENMAKQLSVRRTDQFPTSHSEDGHLPNQILSQKRIKLSFESGLRNPAITTSPQLLHTRMYFIHAGATLFQTAAY
eukprot:gene5941-biopygen2357